MQSGLRSENRGLEERACQTSLSERSAPYSDDALPGERSAIRNYLSVGEKSRFRQQLPFEETSSRYLGNRLVTTVEAMRNPDISTRKLLRGISFWEAERGL